MQMVKHGRKGVNKRIVLGNIKPNDKLSYQWIDLNYWLTTKINPDRNIYNNLNRKDKCYT